MSATNNSAFLCRSRFRITVGKEIALGPGKIDLLEAIAEKGSISSAARKMGLSYRRAWQMVHTVNDCFKSPLVESAKGGKGGGGAKITPLGQRVMRLYRTMESKAEKSTRTEWKSLSKLLKN